MGEFVVSKERKPIGFGTHGIVYAATMEGEFYSGPCAVKVCRDMGSDHAVGLFRREIKMTRRVMEHPQKNLVQVYAAETRELMIVMEYIQPPHNLELDEFLSVVQPELALDVLLQMVDSIRQLYKLFESHGDIKHDNFLLGTVVDTSEAETPIVKLTDFAFCDVREYIQGVLIYCHPSELDMSYESDLLKDLPLLYKRRDQYGFYVSLFAYIFGHLPFHFPQNKNEQEQRRVLLQQIQAKEIDFSEREPSLYSKLNEKQKVRIQNLFQELLFKNDETFNHQWPDELEEELKACFQKKKEKQQKKWWRLRR